MQSCPVSYCRQAHRAQSASITAGATEELYPLQLVGTYCSIYCCKILRSRWPGRSSGAADWDNNNTLGSTSHGEMDYGLCSSPSLLQELHCSVFECHCGSTYTWVFDDPYSWTFGSSWASQRSTLHQRRVAAIRAYGDDQESIDAVGCKACRACPSGRFSIERSFYSDPYDIARFVCVTTQLPCQRRGLPD